ncbi:MAG TPA: 1,4-dihydroxy-6-naphthoate synthase [Chitinophagaceae bacterium]|nr:1,4-dihydroxy-6-naphthoate synthase [Chitinophagaceae bacterium]
MTDKNIKFTLGFSPCPNDTFIFDALVNKKMDTNGLEFDTVLEDVETLNQWALQSKLDITKLSFPAFFQSLNEYVLLDSGSALGKGVGPLLISRSETPLEKVDSSDIAIPGINTTANMLLGFAFPNAKKKVPMIFSAIEDAVLNRETDLGVIIHENRFTYQQKSLVKVIDLGEYWEEKMKAPIPLGGIVIKRNINPEISLKINSLIKKSIEFSFSHYPAVSDYVKQYSQTMSEEVMRQHIDLYVNNFSLSLQDEGRLAIKTLWNVFQKTNNTTNNSSASLFL